MENATTPPPSYQFPTTPIVVKALGLKNRPQEVFKACAEIWEEVLGPAAPIVSYPDRFPERWENLCKQKGADLIARIFRVWTEEKGVWLLANRPNFFVIGN